MDDILCPCLCMCDAMREGRRCDCAPVHTCRAQRSGGRTARSVSVAAVMSDEWPFRAAAARRRMGISGPGAGKRRARVSLAPMNDLCCQLRQIDGVTAASLRTTILGTPVVTVEASDAAAAASATRRLRGVADSSATSVATVPLFIRATGIYFLRNGIGPGQQMVQAFMRPPEDATATATEAAGLAATSPMASPAPACLSGRVLHRAFFSQHSSREEVEALVRLVAPRDVRALVSPLRADGNNVGVVDDEGGSTGRGCADGNEQARVQLEQWLQSLLPAARRRPSVDTSAARLTGSDALQSSEERPLRGLFECDSCSTARSTSPEKARGLLGWSSPPTSRKRSRGAIAGRDVSPAGKSVGLEESDDWSVGTEREGHDRRFDYDGSQLSSLEGDSCKRPRSHRGGAGDVACSPRSAQLEPADVASPLATTPQTPNHPSSCGILDGTILPRADNHVRQHGFVSVVGMLAQRHDTAEKAAMLARVRSHWRHLVSLELTSAATCAPTFDPSP